MGGGPLNVPARGPNREFGRHWGTESVAHTRFFVGGDLRGQRPRTEARSAEGGGVWGGGESISVSD